jgi:mono/diheme cytochrome c family protein
MKNNIRLSLIAAISLVTVLAYQNCSNSMKPLDLDSTGAAATSSGPLSVSQMETQAVSVLTNNCASCHSSPANDGMISYITDVNALKYFRVVIPGEPTVSPMYTVLTQDSDHMTLLSQQQMDLIFGWIQTGMSTAAPVAPPNIVALGPTYQGVMRNIIAPRCLNCHGANSGRQDFSTYARLMASGVVKAGDPNGSLIMNSIGPTPNRRMPPSGNQLTAVEQKAVSDWIAAGALDN